MAPTPSRGRPPTHRKIFGPKSFSFCSFLWPEIRELESCGCPRFVSGRVVQKTPTVQENSSQILTELSGREKTLWEIQINPEFRTAPENNSDHPHPPYLQKICPKNMPYNGGPYGIKVGWNQGISTENMAYRPPPFMAYEPPFYAI